MKNTHQFISLLIIAIKTKVPFGMDNFFLFCFCDFPVRIKFFYVQMK